MFQVPTRRYVPCATVPALWITMAAKRWCFTLNNYNDSDLKRIKESLTEDEVTYAVVGKETGKKGTKHLQGFINFKRKID